MEAVQPPKKKPDEEKTLKNDNLPFVSTVNKAERQNELPELREDIHTLWWEGPAAGFSLNTWMGQGQLDCDCPEAMGRAEPEYRT